MEDYGELKEVEMPIAGGKNSSPLTRTAFSLGKELRKKRRNVEINSEHLRVLDSCNEKSKESLEDMRNCIEFYRTSASARRMNLFSGSSSSADELTVDSEDDDVGVFF